VHSIPLRIWLDILFIEFDSFLNNITKFHKNLVLIAAMTSAIEQAGATADKALVFIGLLDNLGVSVCVSLIASRRQRFKSTFHIPVTGFRRSMPE